MSEDGTQKAVRVHNLGIMNDIHKWADENKRSANKNGASSVPSENDARRHASGAVTYDTDNPATLIERIERELKEKRNGSSGKDR
jgi:hypothetical protein